ncbi:MAG: hypothetical protein ACJ761_05565 [Chloroflexota bacterium]
MEALIVFMTILVAIGLLDMVALFVGVDSRPGFTDPRSPNIPSI